MPAVLLAYHRLDNGIGTFRPADAPRKLRFRVYRRPYHQWLCRVASPSGPIWIAWHTHLGFPAAPDDHPVPHREVGPRWAAGWLARFGLPIPPELAQDLESDRAAAAAAADPSPPPGADADAADPPADGDTPKGTPSGPGRRMDTSEAALENDIMMHYRQCKGSRTPHHDILDALKGRYPDLTRPKVEDVVRRCKRRVERRDKRA